MRAEVNRRLNRTEFFCDVLQQLPGWRGPLGTTADGGASLEPPAAAAAGVMHAAARGGEPT